MAVNIMLPASIFVGFLLHHALAQTTSPLQCGGHLTGTSGTIRSPNYPKTYPYDVKCEWVIEAPIGHVVQLIFLDFDVEDFDGECDEDLVHVRNGQDSSSPILGNVLCGQSKPEMLTSTGRYMLISLISGYASEGGRGFDGKYITKPAGDEEQCIENTCGGNFENSRSCTIQSPNYPIGCSQNLNCTWTIKAPSASDRISFKFLDLDFAFSNSACAKNNITLYNGNTIFAPKIYESACNLQENRLVDKILKSAGSVVVINMRTSAESRSNHGFNGKFEIISEETATTIPPVTTTTTSKAVPVSTTSTPKPTTTTHPKLLTSKVLPKEEPTKSDDDETTSPGEVTTKSTENALIVHDPAVISGLVIGIVVSLAIIVFAILLIVAYVHWKRQNRRFNIRLREEDARSDVNTLISSTDSQEFKFKKNGKIVRMTEDELIL